MRVADYIVQVLATEGVKFVSGFPGDDILPLFDAFYQQAEIPLLITRHEQATVFMADGYARSCGEPGVAVVTQGPGDCNALAAIVNAFTDGVPLLVLFGHNTLKLLGKRILQEAPYLESFIPMAKWTFSIPSPDGFRKRSAGLLHLPVPAGPVPSSWRFPKISSLPTSRRRLTSNPDGFTSRRIPTMWIRLCLCCGNRAGP